MLEEQKRQIVVTFDEDGSVVIPGGSSVTSDIIDFRYASNAKIYVRLGGETGHNQEPTILEVISCGNVEIGFDDTGKPKITPGTDFWESNVFAQTQLDTHAGYSWDMLAPKMLEPISLNYDIDKYWSTKAQFVKFKFTNGDSEKMVTIEYCNIVIKPALKRDIAATFGDPPSKSVTVPANGWIRSNVIDIRDAKKVAVSLTLTPGDSYGQELVFYTNIFMCSGMYTSAPDFWSVAFWDDINFLATMGIKATRVCYFYDNASMSIDWDKNWDEHPAYIQIGLENQQQGAVEVHEVRVHLWEG